MSWESNWMDDFPPPDLAAAACLGKEQRYEMCGRSCWLPSHSCHSDLKSQTLGLGKHCLNDKYSGTPFFHGDIEEGGSEHGNA